MNIIATLVPYIVFKGNCREALESYAKIFNGKIVIELSNSLNGENN